MLGFQIERNLLRMEQLDEAATQNILRAMSIAGVDLDGLATASGIHKATLLRRMASGPWKLQELGRIARALGCRTMDLVSEVAA